MGRENPVRDKAVMLGTDIIRYGEWLERSGKTVISRQLVRSGLSVGANIFEAQFAESRSDFIHKMKVAAKEANETYYWLLICEKSGLLKGKELTNLVEEILRLLSKIIITARLGKKT